MKHFQLVLFIIGLSFSINFQLLAQKRSERTGDKESAKNSGDKVNTRTQKTRKGNKENAQSTGDIRVKNASLKSQSSTSTGDVKVTNNRGINKTSKQAAQNSGDIRVDNSEARKKTKSISRYSGDLDYSVYESRAEGPRNSGSMVLERGIDRRTQKKIANNEGDIGNNYLARRTAMRHKKGKEIANSSGDILVRTLNQKAKKIRKKNKEMANYKGDIIVTRVKKGMHPSAVYRGGKVKNSYTAKERYRKRMMKRMSRKRGLEDSNYMKQKQRQPKHNKKEAEIWY
jgi:hypothetical protein